MTRHLKSPVILLLLLLLVPAIRAAETDSTFDGWKKSLTVDITLTQTGYSDSWVGGEASSVNWVSNVNGMAERQLKDWFNFKSTLKLSFGQTKTKESQTPTSQGISRLSPGSTDCPRRDDCHGP